MPTTKPGELPAVNGSGYMGMSNYASAMTYRAFGSLKGMNYANGRSLSTAYDNRLRPTTWNVANVLGYNYNYDYFNEHTGRVTYAQNIQDPTLDRSYEYDHVGRLVISHSGTEARAHAWTGQWSPIDGPYSQGYEFDVWGNLTRRYGWGGEVQGGGPPPLSSTDISYSYTGNRRDGFSYDAAGNLTNDIGQTFTYDVTGQQATASFGGYSLQQSYDGDGLRVKKNDNGATTYYLRSSVLGGQVVAELDNTGGLSRDYVYLGGQLLALRVRWGRVYSLYWVHEDPVTKSKRVTDVNGAVVSSIELDPWGADTARSNNTTFQPKMFTSYERDGNQSDEAMFRRYNRWQSRFDQPDPYDGSYSLTNPQSFNRYAYVQGDPVNFVDPSGLVESWNCSAQYSFSDCGGWSAIIGGYFGSGYAEYQREYGGLSPEIAESLHLHQQRVNNALGGYGFMTNAELRRTEINAFIRDPLTGEMVPAGDKVWIEADDLFSVMAGRLDSWPPAWPRASDGYSQKFGWKTQPAPQMEQFPEKIVRGPKGPEIRREFDPNVVPSNASRGSRFTRAGISFIRAAAKLMGSTLSAIGGAAVDFVSPISPQAFMNMQCQQHPGSCNGGGPQP